MENTALPQTEKTLDHDSLLLASLILKDVTRMTSDIQMIVILLLRYAAIGASITNSLTRWIAPTAAE